MTTLLVVLQVLIIKEMGHETCKPTATYRPTSSYRYQPYSTGWPIFQKFNYTWCDVAVQLPAYMFELSQIHSQTPKQ